MPARQSFQSASLMGGWVIDMTDLDGAHAAVALCRSRTSEVLEVRQTLWGVQVRTESRLAAETLASCYAETAAAAPLAA